MTPNHALQRTRLRVTAPALMPPHHLCPLIQEALRRPGMLLSLARLGVATCSPCISMIPEAASLERFFEAIRSDCSRDALLSLTLASGQGWHNCVICDEDLAGEFLTTSKWNAKTIQMRDIRAAVTKMNGTDIGTYEVQAL